MTYFFLSQSAILFGEDVEYKITRVGETKTYVRIINEVEAARMAIFPVNFIPNVGYIRRGSSGTGAYRIECIQCLTCHPLAL